MQSIGIDCRFAASHSGLGRYTRELVTHLLKRKDPIHYILFVRSSDEDWIPKNFGQSISLNVFDEDHYTLREQMLLPRALRSAGIDLLFSPHFNVPFLTGVPTVVTVHDLILHRYPNNANIVRQLAYRLLFRRAVTHARHVIAVSRFTAQELSGVYGRRITRKMTVIPEAVSPHFRRHPPEECVRVLERHGIRQPFFLYVGNAKEHKNVPMLLAAFRELGDPSVQLALVTDGPEIERLGSGANVRIMRNVPEEDMPFLYSSARCFVSASLYEGFGLPLLEAHACGCPGIVLNRSSFPEIAPPGTVLTETSVEALTDALRSPPAWQGPVSPRTWADVAAETAAVFSEALKGV